MTAVTEAAVSRQLSAVSNPHSVTDAGFGFNSRSLAGLRLFVMTTPALAQAFGTHE